MHSIWLYLGVQGGLLCAREPAKVFGFLDVTNNKSLAMDCGSISTSDHQASAPGSDRCVVEDEI